MKNRDSKEASKEEISQFYAKTNPYCVFTTYLFIEFVKKEPVWFYFVF